MENLTVKERLIKWFAENLGAKLIARGVTYLGGMLVAHGLMKAGSQTSWEQTTVEIGTGLLTAGLTAWLAKKTDTHAKAATQTAVVTALVTEPPVAASREDLAAAAKQIIEAPTNNGLPYTKPQ